MNSGPEIFWIVEIASNGTGVAVRVAHEELPDIFRVGAIIAFGLYIYLPCSPETIEVVHKKTAHERLEGLIDLAEIDPLLDDFVAIDVDENLRDVRQKRRNKGG